MFVKRYAVWVDVTRDGKVLHRNLYERYWTKHFAESRRRGMQHMADLFNAFQNDVGRRQEWYIIYLDKDDNEVVI